MSVEKFSGQFKNETKGCTVVINSTIQSIKEFDVLGLYVYLCSKPESWQPNAKEIMHHTGYSKDKTYRLINRLLDMGLMTARAIREKGRFLHYEYTIHLHAQGFSSLPENQEPAPCPEKQDTENQDAYKTKNLQIKDKNIISESNDSNNNKNQKQNFSAEEIVQVYHETLPQCPKIKKVDRQLANQLKKMQKDWPNNGSSKPEFTLERFKKYLQALEIHCPGFLLEYVTPTGNKRRNNLRTFTREINIAKFINGEFNFS